MCYRVACKQCGKFTWGGCGKHLTTLYCNIDEGQHCLCRPWPGILIPPQSKPQLEASNSTPVTTTATTPGITQLSLHSKFCRLKHVIHMNYINLTRVAYIKFNI